MAHYRKKPVVIEAVQFDGTPAGATVVIDWVLAGDGTAWYYDAETVLPQSVYIDTLEGTMRAEPGDWVIRGVQGEFYPRKPDIFAATYEPAETDGWRRALPLRAHHHRPDQTGRPSADARRRVEDDRPRPAHRRHRAHSRLRRRARRPQGAVMNRRRFLNLFGMGAVAIVAAPMLPAHPAPKVSKSDRVKVKVSVTNGAEAAQMLAKRPCGGPVAPGSVMAPVGEQGPEIVIPLTHVNVHMPVGSSGEDVVRIIKEYEKRHGIGWRS